MTPDEINWEIKNIIDAGMKEKDYRNGYQVMIEMLIKLENNILTDTLKIRRQK